MFSKLNKSFFALGGAWVMFLVLSLALPNLLTLSAFIVLNAALPFIVIFLVLFGGGFFKAVEDVSWLKLLWVAAGFFYLLVANKWSGDVLNEIFKIDPSFFPTTSKVLTVVFGPLSLYGSSAWDLSYALILVSLFSSSASCCQRRLSVQRCGSSSPGRNGSGSSWPLSWSPFGLL